MSDSTAFPLKLPPLLVERAVKAALKEDLGQAGDITSDAIVPADAQGEAASVARQDGVIAGLDLAEAAFKCRAKLARCSPASARHSIFSTA